jgi:hypothetical protein
MPQVRAGLRERLRRRADRGRGSERDLELRRRQLGLEARVALDALEDGVRPRGQVEGLGVEHHELLLDAHGHGRVRLEGDTEV